MERLFAEIIAALRADDGLDASELDRILRRRNRIERASTRRFAKKHLLPYYLNVRDEDPQLWDAWSLTEGEQAKLTSVLQMKPRRTASGVATITVITKPHPCSSACLYCPNDVRMPKSYLHAEPACQRAERCGFDPYQQVSTRLNSLIQMGHPTDKVELIVLGGTFSDYDADYQIWFITQLFQALNDGKRPSTGLQPDRYPLADAPRLQKLVNEGSITYNRAVGELYADQACSATIDDLRQAQITNETANHRCVGLVVETRADTLDAQTCILLRKLGCTKVQVGVQSTDAAVLRANKRNITTATTERAFELLRLFGFKTHAHFMVNLLGATPEGDKNDYLRFIGNERIAADEIKLYPCALVDGTGLMQRWRAGDWHPYTEEELIDVLSADVEATPPYVRISRMIRDIGAQDIVVGSKKTNLRQLVDQELVRKNAVVREMRSREISTSEVDVSTLHPDVIAFRTSNTDERFLQWVTPDGRLAGFLRLSLPEKGAALEVAEHAPEIGCAMIREVHVYGRAAKLGRAGDGAQHAGLGRALVEQACCLAKEAGFNTINVISAVGTRDYYRHLGFHDGDLYLRKHI